MSPMARMRKSPSRPRVGLRNVAYGWLVIGGSATAMAPPRSEKLQGTAAERLTNYPTEQGLANGVGSSMDGHG